MEKIKIQKKNVRIFFFDESRFGTHSKLGHVWFSKGKRTSIKIKLGFENFYLYSAIDPKTGQHFSLDISHVDTQCFNYYLKEFSKKYKCEKIILVLDGAGWHCSKSLQIPSNIELVHLPPYSPELNPVERFWEHIKYHTIRNRIYQDIKSLRSTVHQYL